MTSAAERRSYPRITSELAVRWVGEPVDKPMRDYLGQVATNVGLGGLFIETENPPPINTLLRLELRMSSEGEPIRATGLVRWRKRWSKPRGIGVEFIDFEGLGEKSLDEWLETIAAKP